MENSIYEKAAYYITGVVINSSPNGNGANYKGLIGDDVFPIDITQQYPKIDFVKYYLWRNDPLLKWSPSVRQTKRYFKENPAPETVSFGERYDLYGDIPQGQMPVESVKTHLDRYAYPEKNENGINKVGAKRMSKAFNKYKGEKLELNKWISGKEHFNPIHSEQNIAGHQMFIDTNKGTLLSKDIWKFNPWDYYLKWGTWGGKASQAGLLDKLGKPFITVDETALTPEALQYLIDFSMHQQ